MRSSKNNNFNPYNTRDKTCNIILTCTVVHPLRKNMSEGLLCKELTFWTTQYSVCNFEERFSGKLLFSQNVSCVLVGFLL